MVRSRSALAGLILVLAYVLLALWSGRISPLARRPLLDGLGPLQAYRWVAPPPDLAATNVRPSPLTLTLQLTSKGSLALSGGSGDKQITVIAPNGAFAPHGADTSVRIDATPLDPATLGKLGDDLAPFGNAIQLRATYLPSNTPVKSLKGSLDVILIYPVTVTLHASTHQMSASDDGTKWTSLKGNDFTQTQQVEAVVPSLGYVVVSGVPGPAPVSVSPPGSGGGKLNGIAIGLFVAAGCALLVGIGLVLRNRKA
jgi:hypothetical protein